MLDNDLIRTILLFLLLALFFWLLLRFLFDWQKDEKVRVRRNMMDEDETKPLKANEPAIVDDLTKIEGVGPKISQILNDAGIVSFADLEATEEETLNRLLEKAGPRYRMHNPETWPKQAKLASAGDWDGLDNLQESLIAGKK